MILGNRFELFANQFNISKILITKVRDSYDRHEINSINQLLFLKQISEERNLNLLLCSWGEGKNEDLFIYCYWIPSELVKQDKSLSEIFVSFINEFGIYVTVNGITEKLIQNLVIYRDTPLLSLYEIMHIHVPSHVPCHDYLFFNDKMHSENKYTIQQCFSINLYTYQFWFGDYPSCEITILKGWYRLINYTVQCLDPDGATEIEVRRPSYQQPSNLNNKEDYESITIKFPKVYKDKFRYIAELSRSLTSGEHLAISVKNKHKFCVFCNSSAVSQEHIFAKWLRKYIDDRPIKSITIALSENQKPNEIGGSLLQKHTKPLYGLTTDKVCTKCNNEWLSQLEDYVSSIVIKDNKFNFDTSVFVEEIAAKKIAIWIIIKAILLAIEEDLPMSIPKETCRYLYEGKVPPGFIVEVMEFPTNDFKSFISSEPGGLFSSQFKLKHLSEGEAANMIKDFFLSTIQVGNYAFRISYINSNIPFIRVSTVFSTKVIYPLNYNLKLEPIKNAEEFATVQFNKNPLGVFNMTLVLKELTIEDVQIAKGFYMVVSIPYILNQMNKYIVAFGRTINENHISLFLDGNNVLNFRIIDDRGIHYYLKVGRNVITFEKSQLYFIYCEYGKSENYSYLRMFINEREVGKTNFNYFVDFPELNQDAISIAAKFENIETGNFICEDLHITTKLADNEIMRLCQELLKQYE